MKRKLVIGGIILSSVILTSCDFLSNSTSNTSTGTVVTTNSSTSTATSTSSTQGSTTTVVPTTTVVTTTNPTTTVTTTAPTTTTEDPVKSDPYENVSRNEFYANYSEAISFNDAQYRTEHGFISGSIDDADRYYLPAESQTSKDYMVTDTTYTYQANGDFASYIIYYANGETDTIYYGGGYVGLNEVCAYIYAFGEVPPNNNYDKGSTGKKNAISDWGKYGRVNVGTFSNNVSKYPDQPELPTKSSKTGISYKYTETDFGATAFTYDGSYTAEYNNGGSINRGTCRVVFTNNAKSASDRHVFYTYNHYGDFQEYLNYGDGFGTRFGDDSSTTSKPTSYPQPTDITMVELRRLLGNA